MDISKALLKQGELMKNKLKKYILDNGFLSDGSCLYSRFKLPEDLHDYLMMVTSYFVEEIRYTDRLLAFLNGQTKLNRCLTCDEPIYPKPNNPQLYCGKKCAATSDFTKAQRAKTNLELYGVENTWQSEDKKEKIKETNLERYGVENPQQSETIRNKAEETNLKLHGSRHITTSEGFAEKARETFIKNYGVSNPSQSDVVKDKKIATCQKNYGVDNPFQSIEVQSKISASSFEKYGVVHHTQTASVQDKKRTTFREREIQLSKIQQAQLEDKDLLTLLYVEKGHSSERIAKDLNMDYKTVIRYLRKHGIEIRKAWSQSSPEISIIEFIQSIYSGEIVSNSRNIISSVELDIYLPEVHLAIEYNGIYWHTEKKGRGKNYHLNKTDLCEKEGIQLLQIWSTDPQEIWESVISSKLGIYEQKIGARKCKIQDVSQADTDIFLSANHLQGPLNSSVNKGLYYENELVALATFSRPRFSTFKGLELLRFCSKKGVQVIGGCSRLLKSVNSPILSYANRRWSNGKLYESTGFILQSIAPPNYFYTKDYIQLHSRIQFQKHKLKDKLEIYDPELSESGNMLMNGYDRIWDCGNLTYIRN